MEGKEKKKGEMKIKRYTRLLRIKLLELYCDVYLSLKLKTRHRFQ